MGNSALDQTVQVLLQTGGQQDLDQMRLVVEALNAKLIAIAASGRTAGQGIDAIAASMKGVATQLVAMTKLEEGLTKVRNEQADAALKLAEQKEKALKKEAEATQAMLDKIADEREKALAKEESDEIAAAAASLARQKKLAMEEYDARASLADQKKKALDKEESDEIAAAAASLAAQKRAYLQNAADRVTLRDTTKAILDKETADQDKASDDQIARIKKWAVEKDRIRAADLVREEATIAAYGSLQSKAAGDAILNAQQAAQAKITADNYVAAVATGNASKIAAAQRQVQQGLDATGKSGQGAARGFLELSRAVEDFTVAGPLGALNNIPGIIQSFAQELKLSTALVAGLTAGVSILATGAYIIYTHWGSITSEMRKYQGLVETSVEAQERLEKATHRTALEEAELLNLTERKSKADAQAALKSEAEQSKEKAVDEVVAEFGGQKHIVDMMVATMPEKLTQTSTDVQRAKKELDERKEWLLAEQGRLKGRALTDDEKDKFLEDASQNDWITGTGTPTKKYNEAMRNSAKDFLARAGTDKDSGRLRELRDIANKRPELFGQLGSALNDVTPEGQEEIRKFMKQGDDITDERAINKNRQKALDDKATAAKHAATEAARLAKVESPDEDYDILVASNASWKNFKSIRDAKNKEAGKATADARREATAAETAHRLNLRAMNAEQRQLHTQAMHQAEAYRKPLQIGAIQGASMDDQADAVRQELFSRGQNPDLAPHIVQAAHDDLTRRQAHVMSQAAGNDALLANNQAMIATLIQNIMGQHEQTAQSAKQTGAILQRQGRQQATGQVMGR